jgi:hypothetical protein
MGNFKRNQLPDKYLSHGHYDFCFERAYIPSAFINLLEKIVIN